MAWEVQSSRAEDELIQGITSAGLASIFPAMPSTGGCALPDFESALFAMLGIAAAPGAPAAIPNPEPAQPAKTANKTAASGSPAKSDGERPPDEKKAAVDQQTALAALLVPVPIATPLLAQVDGSQPKAKPTSAQTEAPDGVPAQAAFTPADSAALVASSPIPAKHPGDDDSATEPTPAPITDRDKALSATNGVKQNIPDASVAIPHQQPATGPAPGPSAPPTDQKLEKILESVKPQFAQFATLDPSADQAVADPGVEDTSLQSASSNANTNPVPVPPSVAQPSDTPAQPVSINAPVVPVNLPAQSAFEQAAGGKSGHNSSAGKFHAPAENPSSSDRPGKEKTSHATTSAETKPDTPNSDAVKAIDPTTASDPAAPKAQPEVTLSEALPPQAPRAETAPQGNFSDPSPKADAPPTPTPNASASTVPLPAERPGDALFSSAQLIDKVSQSELRLGMRTGEFGNIEIRTTFDHQQLRAEISSERGELGQALSAELPGFEQRLREHDVPLSAVVVHQASAGASGGFDRPPRQQQPEPASVNVGEAAEAKPTAAATQPEAWESEGMLDIRI